MEKDYWINRWKESRIGWHQAEVEPALEQWAGKLPTSRIFVPFCGKSLDLIALRRHGHEVVGAELSELACEAFFTENGLQFERLIEGDFTVFRSAGLTLLQGDFFMLNNIQVGQIDAVYDRAALIALPRGLRSRYAEHMKTLLAQSSGRPGFEILQIVLARTPKDEEGPPFSVTNEEVGNLYGDRFTQNILSREQVDAQGPVGAVSHESVLLLSPK